jgi:hypothetical protein
MAVAFPGVVFGDIEPVSDATLNTPGYLDNMLELARVFQQQTGEKLALSREALSSRIPSQQSADLLPAHFCWLTQLWDLDSRANATCLCRSLPMAPTARGGTRTDQPGKMKSSEPPANALGCHRDKRQLHLKQPF